MGPDCYLEPSFEVVCNTATNPEKPYLRLSNTEILELNSSKILIKYFNKATTCYSLSDNQVEITKPEEQRLTIDLLKTQYTLSDENWITTIGCDVMVVGIIGKDKPSSIRSNCAAICSNRLMYKGRINAQCEYETTSFGGEGCCRVPVPRGNNPSIFFFVVVNILLVYNYGNVFKITLKIKMSKIRFGYICVFYSI